MISDFAVEPASIVASVDRFERVVGRFGIDRGRVISDFAGGRDAWANHVRTAAAASLRTVERMHVTERLTQLARDATILRDRDTYAGQIADWENNVIRDHARQPWGGVINQSGTCGALPACASDRVDDSLPMFRDAGLPRVDRTAAALSDLVKPLLRVSRHLDLVDPYLAFDATRWLDPLTALIGAACSGLEIGSIRLHSDARYGTNDADYEQQCRTRLLPRLPLRTVVTINRWRSRPGGDRLHERLVLTELGGTRIDSGLDALPGATTAASRVGRMEVASLRDRYREASSPFELVQRFEISR